MAEKQPPTYYVVGPTGAWSRFLRGMFVVICNGSFFVFIVGGFYLNYKYIGDGFILKVLIGSMGILFLYALATKTTTKFIYKTENEMWEYLQARRNK